MQSLLRWSIENTVHQDRTSGEDASMPSQLPEQQKQFDPELINALMGRPESELMKDALAVATDVEKCEDARLHALDNFEMLIEHIDNANSIEKMGMWPALQELLTSSASNDDVRAAILWIIGTAAQNNPAAQNAYLTLPDAPLSTVLARLSPAESSSGTRSKAVYALSGLLKHNAHGVNLLEHCGGWRLLKYALKDPDITVRRKAVFLLSSLLLPSVASVRPSSHSNLDSSGTRMHGVGRANSGEPQQPEHPNSHAGMTAESTATSATTSAALEKHGIAANLVQALVSPLPHGEDGDEEGDANLEEKLVRLFYTYLTSAGGKLDDKDKKVLLNWIQQHRERGENWDLDSGELNALQDALLIS